MLRKNPQASVYRFRDHVAATVKSEDGTAYLTAPEARALAAALLRAARSVESEDFADSNVGTFRLEEANFKGKPMARLTPSDARALASQYGFDFRADFHALPSSVVDRVLAAADFRRYRKPKNANGSRGRCFFEYVARTASQKD